MSSASALTSGVLLAGRYRLEEPLTNDADGPITLWKAHDDVLARPVALRVGSVDSPEARALLTGARGAAKLVHPSLTRVYDAGETEDFCYIVTELLTGETLEDRLALGPMDVVEAVELLAELADGIARAHAAGLYALRLAPRVVRFSAAGLPRLDTVPGAGTGDRPQALADDVRGLGEIGYAALTGRWPGPSSASTLPPAPRVDGEVCAVRQVRGGIPRELDDLIARAIGLQGPPITSAADFAAALEEVRSPVDPGTEEIVGALPDQGTRWLRSRGQRWSLAAAFIVLILGAVSLLRPGGSHYPQFTHRPSPTTHTPTPTPVTPVAWHPVSIREFDPYGDHTDPHVAEAPNAIDGNPDTAWHTQTFFSPDLGNIKPGVGLLVDLGQSRRVGVVEVQLVRAGATVELLASDTEPATDKDMRLVATVRDAAGTFAFHPRLAARYWLVWLTRLPPSGGGYASGIAELSFQS
ncbi:MAG: hypothetical protein IRZ02_00300 [Acidothermus sp.]|nr:hypothetical protein [Acidothermus sp.]MCL6537362.1 hypothetical protein [Acidothermus sp.]